MHLVVINEITNVFLDKLHDKFIIYHHHHHHTHSILRRKERENKIFNFDLKEMFQFCK